MSSPDGRDKVRLALTISHFDCAPEDITTLLQLDPTRSSALRTEMRVPYWTKHSPADPIGSDPEAQWAGLQPLLAPLTDNLRNLSTRANMTFDLAVTAYQIHCGLFFPASLVAYAAKINAALDVDLYCLHDGKQDG